MVGQILQELSLPHVAGFHIAAAERHGNWLKVCVVWF